MLNKNKRTNYFLFSVEYLVLVALIYTSLVICPLAVVSKAWPPFVVSLGVILVCVWLLRGVLSNYFGAAKKPKRFADVMTFISIFPPVIGPIFVLIYSLVPTA